ncbi:hypothetical protein ACFS07_27510 [Undibacterium arcticum]
MIVGGVGKTNKGSNRKYCNCENYLDPKFGHVSLPHLLTSVIAITNLIAFQEFPPWVKVSPLASPDAYQNVTGCNSGQRYPYASRFWRMPSGIT